MTSVTSGEKMEASDGDNEAFVDCIQWGRDSGYTPSNNVFG